MTTASIKKISIPLQVVLGETECTVEDVASFTEGTVIELKSIAGEPVDLYAAGVKIARGETVIIDENFGIRLTKILDQENQ